MCSENQVEVFSITDHNGIRGTREAALLCSGEKELRFLPGIEIDCNYRGTDLHLLGYQIDEEDPVFETLEQEVEMKFLEATPLILQNLGKLGIEIDSDELMRKSGGKPPTGELIAELLLENPEHHSNPRLLPYLPGGQRSDMPLINFYLDFMAQGKPAHVEIRHMDFKDALRLVQSNNGIPIVAHPGLNFRGREELVSELLDQGARGLEVFNNYHSDKQTACFAHLIRKQGAIMTCGSDFHGKTKPLISIGQYGMLEEFRPYLNQSLEKILNFSI
jgi:predicted metal-dependent phosphoesterase TrpH